MAGQQTLNLFIVGSTPTLTTYVSIVQWIGQHSSKVYIRVRISVGTPKTN